MPLTRDQILNAPDARHEDVDCPEWGGAVRIKTLNGRERCEFDRVYAAREKLHEDSQARVLLVAHCAIDESGGRLFPADEDLAALAAKSGTALERCFKVALRLNGLSNEAQDDIRKN